MQITDQLLQTAQTFVPGITNPQLDEFFNLAENMPVFPGNTISHDTARNLIERGLALQYEGEYCLTEKGKELITQIATHAQPAIQLTAVWAIVAKIQIDKADKIELPFTEIRVQKLSPSCTRTLMNCGTVECRRIFDLAVGIDGYVSWFLSNKLVMDRGIVEKLEEKYKRETDGKTFPVEYQHYEA